MSFKCYCKLRFESFATAVFCDFEEKRGLNFSWYHKIDFSKFDQGCGSGSGLDPDSIGSVDPDSDPGGQK